MSHDDVPAAADPDPPRLKFETARPLGFFEGVLYAIAGVLVAGAITTLIGMVMP